MTHEKFLQESEHLDFSSPVIREKAQELFGAAKSDMEKAIIAYEYSMEIMTNHIVNTIFKRRSIRNYLDKDVEKEKLILLLKVAMAAPTAAKKPPWEFKVVCGNMKLAFSNKDKEIWTQDCSAAIENMLIAAVELGLGSVWIGLYPILSKCKPVSKVLNFPEYIIPMSVVYFGYPAE